MFFIFKYVLTPALIAVIPYFAFQWFRFLQVAFQTDGPSLWFLLTNLPSITKDTLSFSALWCQQYAYKIVRVFLLDNVVFLVSDADDVAALMKNKNTCDKPFLHYGVLGTLLGRDTLLSINGERSKKHRKALNPAFRKEVLESYLPLFNSEAKTFVNQLPTEISFDINSSLYKFQLATSCKAMLRSDQEIAEELPDICEHLDSLFEYAHVKSVNPLQFYLFERFGKRYRSCMDGLAKALGKFQESTLKIKSDLETMVESKDPDFRPSSTLEHILYKRNMGTVSLTADEICAELLLLVGATTGSSAGIVLVLALLARYPDAQRKVREELASIFGDSERDATMSDVGRMEFLDRVLKETLRLHPIIPMMSRSVKEETEIRGTVVPKGSIVGVIISALHRNPKYFEKPDEFDPDRFLPGYAEKMPEYTYMPYGAGERMCIGQRYVGIQIKMFVSAFLRKYEVRPGDGFRPIDDMKLRAHVFLQFPEGVPLRFVPVKLVNQ